MGLLGGISGKEAVRRFERIGYHVTHQRGSHVRLWHTDTFRCKPLTVPMHRELKKGLLRQLIQDAGLSVEEFHRL